MDVTRPSIPVGSAENYGLLAKASSEFAAKWPNVHLQRAGALGAHVLNRDLNGLLAKASSEFAASVKYRPKQGVARGMILERIDLNKAGEPEFFVYKNTKSGQTLSFKTPQQ